MPTLSRRAVLTLPLATLLPPSPALASANQAAYANFWEAPRSLWLYRAETGETGRFEYWRDGRLQLEAWYALLYLLRDVRAEVMMHYDPRAVDIVWAVQEWAFRDTGKRPRFRLSDGGRTEETNARLIAKLAREGKPGADPESLHKKGRAIDGQVEGLTLRRFAAAARFFQMGGVGLYGSHVHVDSGAVRKWGF